MGPQSKELRILPSDPDYEHINQIQELIAIAVNPQAHFWGGVPLDPEQERKAIVETLRDEQQRIMDTHDTWLEAMRNALGSEEGDDE